MPGVISKDVSDMESALRSKSNDIRTQKEAVRDLLRRATLVSVGAQCHTTPCTTIAGNYS